MPCRASVMYCCRQAMSSVSYSILWLKVPWRKLIKNLAHNFTVAVESSVKMSNEKRKEERKAERKRREKAVFTLRCCTIYNAPGGSAKR